MPDGSFPRPVSFRARVWVVVLLLAVCFLGVVDHDLWTADEPRVASISHTMQQTREWVVPRLAGEIFVEKPPLYFWFCGWMGTLLAPLFRFMGPTQAFVGAARLSVACCALGTLLAAFWLGSLFWGKRGGWLTTMSLATMPLFADQMHAMRVDPLLACCVGLSVAAVADAYIRRRGWMLALAGVFAAGAFLTKGPIGVILIGIAWIPLAWTGGRKRLLARKRGDREGGEGRYAAVKWVGWHAVAALLFILFAGSWVWALWARDNPSAWRAWFLDNQLGRFQGTVTALGHRNPYAFWYYPETLIPILGAWGPLFGYWLVWRGGMAWRKRRAWRDLLCTPAGFAACWGFGAMAMLTCSVTKRGIYLLPLHVAYALMCADAARHLIQAGFPKWMRAWVKIFSGLVLLFLAGTLLLPAAGFFLPPAQNRVVAVLLHYSGYHAATAVLLGLGIWIWQKGKGNRGDVFGRWFAFSALLLAGYFLVPVQAIDAGKSMGQGFKTFAALLPTDPTERAHIAAWNFDETVRAGLEFYGGVVLPPLKGNPASDPTGERRLLAILRGNDPEFRGVVIRLGRQPGPEWLNPWLHHASGSVDVGSKRRLRYLRAQPPNG